MDTRTWAIHHQGGGRTCAKRSVFGRLILAAAALQKEKRNVVGEEPGGDDEFKTRAVVKQGGGGSQVRGPSQDSPVSDCQPVIGRRKTRVSGLGSRSRGGNEGEEE